MGSKHPAGSDTGILKPSAAVCPAPRAGVGSSGRRAGCSPGCETGVAGVLLCFLHVWLFSRFALKEREMAHYCSVGHSFSLASGPPRPWGPPGPHTDHASHSRHGAWLPLGVGVWGPPGPCLELQRLCSEAGPGSHSLSLPGLSTGTSSPSWKVGPEGRELWECPGHRPAAGWSGNQPAQVVLSSGVPARTGPSGPQAWRTPRLLPCLRRLPSEAPGVCRRRQASPQCVALSGLRGGARAGPAAASWPVHRFLPAGQPPALGCQLCAIRCGCSRRPQAPRAGGRPGAVAADIPEDTRLRTDAVTWPRAQPGLAAWATSLAGVAGTPGLRAEGRWALGRGPQHLSADPSKPCSCPPRKRQPQAEQGQCPAVLLCPLLILRAQRGSPSRKMAGPALSHCP